MDRRRQQRVFVDLPVQIWGMDAHSRPFSQPASVRSISGRGATLQGVDVQLKPGEIVDVQYGGAKAQFRIVWLGKQGSEMQGEVGVESLSTDKLLWMSIRCAVQPPPARDEPTPLFVILSNAKACPERSRRGPLHFAWGEEIT